MAITTERSQAFATVMNTSTSSAAVVAMMQRHVADVAVQARACFRIGHCCDSVAGWSAEAGAAGGVEAVLAAVAAHPTDEDVQHSGCIALHALLNYPGNCSTAAAAGAPVALVAAMRAFPLHTGVQGDACGCLATLSRDEHVAAQAGSCGAVEAVMAALQAHTADERVRSYACGALARMLQGAHTNCSKAHAAGAVPAVLAVLSTSTAYCAVTNACGVIAALATNSPESAKRTAAARLSLQQCVRIAATETCSRTCGLRSVLWWSTALRTPLAQSVRVLWTS
jgi:hypothetical protein